MTTDNDLSLTSVTNNLPLGLVWYSLTHGYSDFGDFTGLKVKDGAKLSATNMPGTFNYMLAFLNKCNSANDGLGNVTALANKFGPDCAVVGWTGKVNEPIAMQAGAIFFDWIKDGKSVDEGVAEVIRRIGGQLAFLGNDGGSRYVRDALVVFRNGGTVIDLK